MPLRFAVVGTGGVGGYFGAKLHAGGADVHFLARGAHLEAMRTHGLVMKSGTETIRVPPEKIAAKPDEAGQVDVVLFCVKSYDTATAARSLAPLLHDETVVISLQNGIDNEDRVARIIPRGVVFGGVAYVYATITAPGVITEWGGPRKIVFGPRNSLSTLMGRAEAIHQEVRKAGIDAEATADIATALWTKFLFITAVGGITALTRLTLGEILASPETTLLLRRAMEETTAVGRASGITIPPGHLDDVFSKLARYDNATRSSLYNDLANGRRLEIDALSGTVVKLGRERGVPTPVHEVIYAALVPYHRTAEHRDQGPGVRGQ